jgi:hypothetical protein
MLHAAAANFHAIRGDHVAARVDADLALDAARRAHNPTALASAQFGVAMATWSQDRVGAVRALDEAIRIAQTGVAGALLGYALARRSVMRADRRDLVAALRDARDAIRQGDDRADRAMLTMAIECAMGVLEAAGRTEAALVLAGAFEAMLHDWSGRALDFGMARDLGMAERVRRAKGEMGAEAGRAQARGRSLDLAAAVAYARAELDAALADVTNGGG